jgi:hypothetical protein
MQQANPAFRPDRRTGFENVKQPEAQTCTPKDVREERSPSPVEEETLGSIVPIELDEPMFESMESVSSTDSGLMGRVCPCSIQKKDPELIY